MNNQDEKLLGKEEVVNKCKLCYTSTYLFTIAMFHKNSLSLCFYVEELFG